MAKKKEEITEVTVSEPVEVISETTGTTCEQDCALKIELARLRKLHQDQVELGINPDAKLEVLIAELAHKLK